MANWRFGKRIRLPDDAYSNPENAFHVVLHAATGTTPFQASVGDAVWKAILAEFDRPSVTMLAACLMPDHFHAIVKPGQKSVVSWVNGFKSYTTHIARTFTRQRTLWQPSFYDRSIRDSDDYDSVVFYVLNNPVEAGLVSNIESWSWTKRRCAPLWAREVGVG